MDFDLVVIGGGINGASIARDAVGRGWSVLLCEQGDLAGATSSASTKLVHGGLRYLEYYEFRLVREALAEREVLWAMAPHIIWPLRFVLPHHKGLRPAWLLRLGLALYDHIGGRKLLPPTRTLRLRSDPAGAPLKPEFTRAFEYSDCWVEDSRLVVLTARDAADRGAEILVRTGCTGAVRESEGWAINLDGPEGCRTVHARAVVNAAGPWVASLLGRIAGSNSASQVRLVQGSHIIVPKLYAHDRCYIFQNSDNRIFFAIPYEQDFTLIGTTDLDYRGDPAAVRISTAEIDYLCDGASGYFKSPVTPEMVVWSYSGVRPLRDDGASSAQAATRDYVLELDAPDGAAALLSVFGGKITTSRRLAEHAIDRLTSHLPKPTGQAAGWTGKTALPGGDFPPQGFATLLAAIQARYSFLPDDLARRLVRAYGTRVVALLGDARCIDDLGEDFGAGLSERELHYLIDQEWARQADDVVWRRSKLGLRLKDDAIAAIDAAMRRYAEGRTPA